VKNSSSCPFGSCHPRNGKNRSLSNTSTTIDPTAAPPSSVFPSVFPGSVFVLCFVGINRTVLASNSKGSKDDSVAGARTHPRRRSTTSAVPRLGPTPTAAADDAPSCLTPTGAHGPLGDNDILTDDSNPEPDSVSPSSSTRTPDPASHRISNGGGTRLISSATRDATAIHPAPAQTPVRYTATGTEPVHKTRRYYNCPYAES
jgi:hypothetical protein